jgi:hypothetical protein
MAYIDTSVLVAYYYPEPLSGAAEECVRGIESPSISLLTRVEFCSALAIKVRTGGIDKAVAERILSRFRVHLEEQRYSILPIEAEHYLLAADWIGRFSAPLRSLDALHLAVAFAGDLRLLTADEALARSAEHFGIEHTLIT